MNFSGKKFVGVGAGCGVCSVYGRLALSRSGFASQFWPVLMLVGPTDEFKGDRDLESAIHPSSLCSDKHFLCDGALHSAG